MPTASNNSPPSDVESWIEKIVDGGEGNVPRQVFLGGVSGWLTGFLAMKVGKAAATAIGGGILLLQIAKYNGYIDINWTRVNKDMENAQRKLQKDGRKSDWTNKLENKLNKAADKAEEFFNRGETVSRRWYHKVLTGEDLRMKDLQVFFIAFAGGVAIGVLTGS
jgi:FUN14 domain-containing protein 1